MLAIQVGNGGQGIDENPVTVHKGVQFYFIIDGVGSWSGSIHKVCSSSSISDSISGNFCDFSQFVAEIGTIVNGVNKGKSSKTESTKNNDGQNNVHIKFITWIS